MKLLIKMFIAALVFPLIFLGIKAYQPSIQSVYPEKCAFLIDEQFSAPFQAKLQMYVNQKYQSSKDVEKILHDISERFNEIQSADAYICKTDHLCFSFDASKPLFLLNEQVVCSNFQLANKEHYHSDIVCKLSCITSSMLLVGNMLGAKKLADFVVGVPLEIFQEFHVHWQSGHEIILSQKEFSGKNKRSDDLIFSASRIPTLEDVFLFKKIQSMSKTHKKQMYDFRFKDQIVVK